MTKRPVARSQQRHVFDDIFKPSRIWIQLCLLAIATADLLTITWCGLSIGVCAIGAYLDHQGLSDEGLTIWTHSFGRTYNYSWKQLWFTLHHKAFRIRKSCERISISEEGLAYRLYGSLDESCIFAWVNNKPQCEF
jgi:hypothetical protein